MSNRTLLSQVKSEWPDNVYEMVLGTPPDAPLNQDQLNGLEYALNQLMPREKEIVIKKLTEHRTFSSIKDDYGVNSSRIAQLFYRAIWKIRNSQTLMNYIRFGIELTQRMTEVQRKEAEIAAREADLAAKLAKLIKNEERLEALKDELGIYELGVEEMPIEELDLSPRAYCCLRRGGYEKVGQLIVLTPDDLMRVRNLGWKTRDEIIEKVLKVSGIDIRQNG